MKKIIVALLLMVCVASVAVAEVGRYQLISGKYHSSVVKPNGEGTWSMVEGLFKIDTQTGEVWEYMKTTKLDDDGMPTKPSSGVWIKL